MKRFTFFTAMTMTALAMSAVTAAADAPRFGNDMQKSRHEIRKQAKGCSVVSDNHNYSLKNHVKTSRLRAEESLFPVHFNLSEEKYALNMIVCMDATTGELAFVGDADNMVTQLPAGTYNFMFWGYVEDDDSSCDHILSKENVNISAEQEVEIDFSKCTGHLQFEPKLANGEPARTDLINLDTEEVVEKGNISFGTWTYYVFMGNTLIDWVNGGMERGTFSDGWSYDDNLLGNVMVNPDNNIISVLQIRQMIGGEGNEGIYYPQMLAAPARGGVYSNDISDYAYLHNPYNATIATDVEQLNLPVMYSMTVYNGVQIYDVSWLNTLGIWKSNDEYWIGRNVAEESLRLSFYPCPGLVTGKGSVFSDDNWVGYLSNPVVNRGGEIEYLATVNTFNTFSNMSANNKFRLNDKCQTIWEINEVFSFAENSKKIEDGASVPILVTEQLWYPKDVAEQEGLRSVLFHSYKGRNGEGRTVDLIGESVSVKINGINQDLTGYTSLHQFTKEKADERLGKWEITIVDNNCDLNGTKGLNTTIIKFDDLANDVCAPTLQMLQTIDNQGNVTDMFDKSADGKIVLAGGDFNTYYNTVAGQEWFSVDECNITVEYSVSGANEWTALEVTEIADRYMEPGWGLCWEAPLASIPASTEERSYDLRITLTDSTGNSQQQVLSPVFTVKASSGIDSISASSSTARYYNLQGMEVSAPENGNIYIEALSDGRVRKVMITR